MGDDESDDGRDFVCARERRPAMVDVDCRRGGDCALGARAAAVSADSRRAQDARPSAKAARFAGLLLVEFLFLFFEIAQEKSLKFH